MLPLGQNLGPFRPDHFAIVSFLPAAIWASWLVWQAGRRLGRWLKVPWFKLALPALMVVAWTAWGWHLSADIVNSVTTFVTPADLRTLDWVKNHTPEDALFFINTAYWLNDTYRGVDGGGWLLPYTGRWALVPTVFYGFSPDLEYQAQVRGWGEQASVINGCSPEFWNLISDAKITWVYISSNVGSLNPPDLVGCQQLQQVYTNGRNYIYKILP
jgi:hypothetical protein